MSSALAIHATQSTSSLHPHLPRLPDSGLPEASQVAAWRRQAEAILERCLADQDSDILRGEAPEFAGLRAVDEWMSWVRRSLTALVRPEGLELVRGELRQSFALAWRLAADDAVAEGAEDPGAVERFCRRYLAVADQHTREGYAALVALRT
ncbi:MAG: hypothetical protein H6740_19920 [Alphaproteobacteria bacterium]|nr:hypothetical protein [Alphaproteobacteria bacterium]